MLMPIQFPNELVIAGGCEIEVRNATEVALRRFSAALRIASPRRRRAVIDRGREDGNAAGEHLIGERDQFGGRSGGTKGVGDRGRR